MLVLATTASAGNDKPIQVSQLPQTAQQFIKKYFGDRKVAFAKEESDFRKSYEIAFKNGDKIDLKKLSAELGCQAVEISALKGEGTEAAAKAAKALEKAPEDEKLKLAAENAQKAFELAKSGEKIPETFKDFLEKWVYSCEDQSALLDKLGGSRLMRLKNEPHLGYSTTH